MSESPELLARRLARERAARLEAERLLEVKAAELYETNVELQSLIVELDEVVARRTAEALAARDEAVAASQAKTAFLANMSHEIRTPLASIIGFAELLIDGRTSVGREEALDAIIGNGRHLLEVINDILDVSKIEADGLELDCVDLSLPTLLHEVDRLTGHRARDKGLAFAVEPLLPLPTLIRGDPVRLRQILVNFCSNAVKFTAQGSVRLTVGIDGECLRFEVIDTGIGMSPDQCERLFKPFVQADVSTTRRFGGTGLGLYISKRMADLMGGVVSVCSEPGQGSCFALRVPLATATGARVIDDLERWRQESGDSSPALLKIPQLGGQVLLAEDGPHNQRLIGAHVESTGAELTVVGDGEQAVQQALAGEFDLVLMDIQMPVMDGVAAVTLLRDAGYSGPIVALTANVMREDIEKYRAIGCNDVLAKPIDRARLYAALQRHLPAAGDAQADAQRDAHIAAVVERLSRQFRGELPDTIAQLQQAVAERTWSELRQLAHRIKGLAGSIGYPHLSALAHPLELSLIEGDHRAAQGHCERLVAALGATQRGEAVAT